MIAPRTTTDDLMHPSFSFPGQTFSWAGPGRHPDEFCLGTEDGMVIFTSRDFGKFDGFRLPTEQPEAINGVAIYETSMAISTRREVLLITLPSPGQKLAGYVNVPCGAHDVTITGSNKIVAACGTNGFVTAIVTNDEQQELCLHRVPVRTVNFYRVANIGSQTDFDRIAFAARHDGVAVTEIDHDGNTKWLKSLSRDNLDIVDVCTFEMLQNKASILAVGKDGTLVFVPDFNQDSSPIPLHFSGVQGVAYRVMIFEGSVLLLTSVALYAFIGLAERISRGENVDVGPHPVRLVTMEAVDANLASENDLLIVLPDQVIRLNLQQLVGGTSPDKSLNESWTVTHDVTGLRWITHHSLVESVAAS